MEENNKNEIFQILGAFENEWNAKNQLRKTNLELETVKYYEKFTLKDIKNRDMDFSGIFITTEKNPEGKISYHMYLGDTATEILSVDADGNLKVLNMDDNAYITGKPEVLYECQTDAGAITGIEYIPTSDGYSI